MENNEAKKNVVVPGFIFILLGYVLIFVHDRFGESNVTDFISGAMLGVSVVSEIVGLLIIGKARK